MPTSIVEQYLTPLLAGNRTACRELLFQRVNLVADPSEVYTDVLWPAMERVEKLYRSDRINAASEHMATRINRSLADQLQTHLKQAPRNGKSIVVVCASGEPEELGAQMCADLFEARGWEVYFLGGGVPNDEVLTLVGQVRPDMLLVFGTQPGEVPGVRHLVDLIREIGVNPTMNIMTSGGVFNRAAGLWKEVNADLFARTASEAFTIAESAQPRTPTVRVAGAPKRRRRRRRPPVLAAQEA